jgi:anthranilate phosphoribosyltransferase
VTDTAPKSDDWVAMRDILSRIAIGPVGSRDLTREAARGAMRLALEGEVSPVQQGAFLLAARLKRETTEENQGFLDALITSAHVCTAQSPDVVSLADPYNGFTRTPHFAAPTAAVLAACGVPTYLHGGDNVPPKHGLTARQVFEERGQGLGIGGGLASVQSAAQRLDEVGVAYVDVADFCPPLAALNDVRRDIAKRPCLALLEKLISPLRGQERTHVVTGWVHQGYQDEIAALLRDRGVASATLVKGREGHVDPAVHKDTLVVGYDRSGQPLDLILRPKSYGLLLSETPDFGTLSAAQVSELWDDALHRKRRQLPGQTVRLLAGTVLTQVGKASTVMRGVGLAHEAIVSGRARDLLASFSA